MSRIHALRLGWLLPAALLGGGSAQAAGSIAVERIAAELPPGFHIQGPNAYWSCQASDDSRAVFYLASPEQREREARQLLAQGTKNMEDSLLATEAEAWEEGDEEKLAAIRAGLDQFDAELKPYSERVSSSFRPPELGGDSLLKAQFSGMHEKSECRLEIEARLPAPGPQIIDDFDVRVLPAQQVIAMRALRPDHIGSNPVMMEAFEGDPDHWEPCGRREGCHVPRLVLEHGQINHISGSFQFTLQRHLLNGQPVEDCVPPGSPIEPCRTEQRVVHGFFNATSKMSESGSPLLDALNRMDATHGMGERLMPGYRFDLDPKKSPIEIEHKGR